MKIKQRILLVGLILFCIIYCNIFAESLPEEQLEEIYLKATLFLESENFEEAYTLFKSLEKYKDSRSLASQSLLALQTRKYKNALALFENEKFEEAQKLFKELDDFRESKNLLYKTNMAILRRDYFLAKTLYKNGEHKKAYAIFTRLGSFAESEKYAKEVKVLLDAAKQLSIEKDYYLQAEKLLEEKKLLEAREMYIASGDFQDSYEKIKTINYQLAIDNIKKRADRFLQSNNFIEAGLLFSFLKDNYTEKKINEQYIDYLKKNSNNSLEIVAITAFEKQDSSIILDAASKETIYAMAQNFLEKEEKAIAVYLFSVLDEYNDSASLAERFRTLIEKDNQFYFARLFREVGDYQSANELFLSLGDYRFADKYITPNEHQFTVKQLRDYKTSKKSQIFISPNGTRHVYQIFKGVPTWLEAKAFCEILGGHLATIQSEEENTFVHDFMIASGYTEAYLGLSDEGRKGNWEWITGEPFIYSNWAKGEPSHSPRERFAMFFTTILAPYTWNDSHFYEHAEWDPGCSFICEWDFE